MGKILKFEGVGKEDVYNPTGLFKVNGVTYIAARVEKSNVFWQDPGYEPKIIFFSKKNHFWFPAKGTPVLKMMEDPFKTFISGEIVLGGVKVFGEPKKRKFRTVFLKGRCMQTLRPFAAGPEMMKDIRLVELLDGRIGVFTRPQGGEKYKRGRIGFIIINNLKELTPENIKKARIIDRDLKENEWEGVNDAKLLESGEIAVLAHAASINKKKERRYVATSFVFCPKKMRMKNFEVIATRDDLPPAPAKSSNHEKVVFPGEIVEIHHSYRLYTGVGDAVSFEKKIENPYGERFLKRP